MLGQRIGLVLLVLLTFSPLFSAEFVRFDDAYTLHHNPRLNPPGWGNLAAYWREWRTGELGLYVPFTYTVWMALGWLGRVPHPDVEGSYLNPWIFHGFNVALHAISALVVFALLSRLLRNRWAAWIAAALWAVHPVQVETVAWASGLKDLLGGFFSLLAIWSYVRAAQEPNPKSPAARISYGLSLLCVVLGMLSKPSTMVVGPLCLIVDLLLIGRPMRTAIMRTLPMMILALPLAIVARNVQTIDVNHFMTPLWGRPLVAADALAFYFRQIVFPIHLALDYGRRPEVILARPPVYATALVVVMVVTIALWWTRQRPLWAGGLIFIAALLPVLGLTVFQFQQFSTTSDHYLYVALLGPAIMAGWAIERCQRPAMYIVAAAVLLILSARSFAQARIWHDDFVLFPHVIDVTPESFLAHNNLGTAYQSLAEREGVDRQRALETALDEFKAAIALKDDYYEAYQHYAAVARALGRSDDADAALETAGRIHQQRIPAAAP